MKHLVQIFTDPGGKRTLSVGSICLVNPFKQAAGRASQASQHAAEIEPTEVEED
jgi:hypothetical protein